MPRQKDDVPAWLMCEDILNKAKTELITEAMDTLHEEVVAKNIEITGSLIKLPEKPSDTELDMFVINRLLDEAPKIKEVYGKYVSDKDSGEAQNSSYIQRMENLKRFLMSIDKISILMSYGHKIDDWVYDVSMLVQIDDPVKIIEETLKNNSDRNEIIKFILGNKTFLKEEIFTKDERSILEMAYNQK